MIKKTVIHLLFHQSRENASMNYGVGSGDFSVVDSDDDVTSGKSKFYKL